MLACQLLMAAAWSSKLCAALQSTSHTSMIRDRQRTTKQHNVVSTVQSAKTRVAVASVFPGSELVANAGERPTWTVKRPRLPRLRGRNRPRLDDFLDETAAAPRHFASTLFTRPGSDNAAKFGSGAPPASVATLLFGLGTGKTPSTRASSDIRRFLSQ